MYEFSVYYDVTIYVDVFVNFENYEIYIIWSTWVFLDVVLVIDILKMEKSFMFPC